MMRARDRASRLARTSTRSFGDLLLDKALIDAITTAVEQNRGLVNAPVVVLPMCRSSALLGREYCSHRAAVGT